MQDHRSNIKRALGFHYDSQVNEMMHWIKLNCMTVSLPPTICVIKNGNREVEFHRNIPFNSFCQSLQDTVKTQSSEVTETDPAMYIRWQHFSSFKKVAFWTDGCCPITSQMTLLSQNNIIYNLREKYNQDLRNKL